MNTHYTKVGKYQKKITSTLHIHELYDASIGEYKVGNYACVQSHGFGVH